MTPARVLGTALPLLCLAAAVVLAAYGEAVRRARRRHASILAFLRDSPDSTARDISRMLLIPYTLVCAELDYLEEAGRVARHRPLVGRHTYSIREPDEPTAVRPYLVHDYRPDRLTWGRNIMVHHALDNGEQLRVSGWGHGIHPGDKILLEHEGEDAWHAVTAIQHHQDPADMWAADLARTAEGAHQQ
ncbi:helix-turn-helix domain-containing protein [Streptomyces sp. TRM68367]|uniref:MarR family transcriptional regulator n=1 Tax=Streptomyces sp. TRM68367 TaxID=2758415 RepID=UPI00165C880D|nr:helix-turn-helix domain-containing protein [Streptomyces sp. TRM68367]MBC9731219.1 MarR family transcriptional regulator [Streptomyces sp. TRM68367]